MHEPVKAGVPDKERVLLEIDPDVYGLIPALIQEVTYRLKRAKGSRSGLVGRHE